MPVWSIYTLQGIQDAGGKEVEAQTKTLGFITFHYKGRKNTKKRLRQKVGRAAVRALSNLTPNCGVHVNSPQTSTAAECACWGQNQPGHQEGDVEPAICIYQRGCPAHIILFPTKG